MYATINCNLAPNRPKLLVLDPYVELAPVAKKYDLIPPPVWVCWCLVLLYVLACCRERGRSRRQLRPKFPKDLVSQYCAERSPGSQSEYDGPNMIGDFLMLKQEWGSGCRA